ncbi:hypothetical protein TRFO_31087 [Tritrichomonas foetus]|uniref:Uncharacterized protein n=1 Tax=Tritrichomonas foetus TaxID=1144522 RepID=A0A1J4JU04_9EUKA|nr:hypothetical protein TRFO_31087 [Tritrichomonas foetus]|eukprot:OHT01952.1 hypothetical protein TRFO_31087 [Tritrichomonas foetus]
MEELIAIAERQSPMPIRDVTRWIYKKNVELANSSPEKIADFFSVAFDFISQNSANHQQPDWDRLRFLLIVMIISLFPMSANIPPISILTDHGPLFSILLVLHSFRNDHSELLHQYMEAFNKGLDTFDKGFSVKSFYSLAHCYYLQALPGLLKNHLSTDKFTELLNVIFETVSKVKPETININFISFTTDMFRQITHHLMKNNLPEMTSDFVRAFRYMLEICYSCPTIILLNLLHPWYAFIKFIMDQKQRNTNVNYKEQIEILTRFYESVASGKYHELHRGFPWYIAILFYGWTHGRKQQARVLSLICHAFRSVLRLEGMRGVREATKEIHTLMYNQRTTDGSWAIFHILTSCESTLALGISDLKKIHGITIKKGSKNRKIKQRWVKFSEQIFEEDSHYEIDNELSTKIYQIEFPDFESAKKNFEEQIAFIDTGKYRLMTGITFQFLFIESILADLSNEDNFVSSVAFHYITKLIKLGIKLMIISSQRLMMLQLFNTNEILTNYKNPSQPNTSARIPSFSIICQRYMEFTERIPPEYYPLLAREIAQMLFKAKKKGQISLLFVQSFSFLQPENSNSNIPPQQSLFSHVLCQLMEIASDKLNYLLSNSSDEARLIYEWIIFIIRLGKPNGNSFCHPSLFMFLKNYHRLISSSVVSNIKKISNQTFALKMIKIYFNSINAETEGGNSNEDADHYKIRSIQRLYEEIQPYSKIEALKSLLKIVIPDKDSINIPSLLNLLHGSLISGDDELIRIAADLCLKIFGNNRKIDNNSPFIMNLFNSWFGALSKLPEEYLTKLVDNKVDYVPSFATSYLNSQRQPQYLLPNLIHDGTGFNLADIIHEVTFNMTDDKDELINLFTIVVHCFEIIKGKLGNQEAGLKELMKTLLSLLCYCSNFNFIKDQISAFSNDLIHYFAKIFAEGKSNLFILSLISFTGNNRSENSKYSINLCISFFEYVKTLDINIDYCRETVDEMMNFFNPNVRLFSMLSGLTLFTRFLPMSVSLQTIRSFLISSNEYYIYDIEFTAILNKMLKQYLNSKSYEEQREFVLVIFDILSQIPLSCSLVLLKRLGKLNIKLPIYDCDEIDKGGDPLLAFQRLSAALVCGVECPLVLNDKMKKMIHDFITAKIDNANFIEKLARKMSLCMAIIKSPDAFHMLSSDSAFIKNFLSFYVNTLSSRIPSMTTNAEKAFKILITQYHDDDYTSRQIEEYCNSPEKIFNFFSPQHERIAFYRRLTKIIPQKMPPSIIIEFFNSIFKYCEYKDCKKFALVSNLLHFVKYLTIESFINSDPVRSIVLSPCQDNKELTYLQAFIEKVLILYQHQEIPFRAILQKHVRRFLKMFPQETIDFIVKTPSKSNQSIAFNFLTDLIKTDDSLSFFNVFIAHFEINRDYSAYHPSMFTVLLKLSENPNFAELPAFQSTLDTIIDSFNKNLNEIAKRGTRLFTTMMEVGYAEINTFRINPDIHRLLNFTQIFNVPSFCNTHIYRRFISVIFKKGTQEFISSIVNFIMNTKPSITAKVFEILLGHALKYLNKIDDDMQKIIWQFLTNKFSQHSSILTAPVIVCIIRLLPKHLPSLSEVKVLLTALQSTISSPETHIVLYSIKLSCEFVKLNLMPDELYCQIAQQLFSYSKFFDQPYADHTYRFLNMRKDLAPKLPDRLIETIAFFPHDKFMSIRELKRFTDIFTEIPHLLVGLPFSLITTLALHLESRLLQRKAKDDYNELDPLFISGMKFCIITKPPEIEVSRFIKACFTFFKFILTQSNVTTINTANNNNKEFLEMLFEYLITNGCKEFPTDILDDVDQNNFMNYSFGFVCCASKYAGNILETRYTSLIEKALIFVQDSSQTINSLFLRTLLEFINSSTNLVNLFYPVICQEVDILLRGFNDVTRDRIIILSKGMIIGADPTKRLKHLIDLWYFFSKYFSPNIPQQHLSISSMFRFLVSCTCDLPILDQPFYVKLLLEKINESNDYPLYFTSVLPLLIDSEEISNTVKETLFDAFPILFSQPSHDVSERMVNFLDEYEKKTGLSMKHQKVAVLLAQCKFCSHADRIINLKKIMNTIPNITFEEFIEKLPLLFWSNDYLAITTSLITRLESPIWYSIFAFSPKLFNIASKLASSSFTKFITKENAGKVNEFFLNILLQKPSYNYSHVTEALLNAFHNNNMFLSTGIVEKSLKYSPNQELLVEYLNNDVMPSISYFMPHILNDSLFSKLQNTMSPVEASAVSLTFLNEYQAASSIYQNADRSYSKFFEVASNVNSCLLSVANAESSFESYLHALYSINQENDSILAKLKSAVEAFERDSPDADEILLEAQMMNLRQLQKHRKYSLFDKEKFITIDSTIQILKSRIQSKQPLISVMDLAREINPTFLNIISTFDNFLDGNSQSQSPAIVSDFDAAVLVSGTMSDDFACVAGITPHGLLAVGKQQIDSFMLTMSLKITENQTTAKDWCKFAPFCFNVFLAQPSLDLFQTTFCVYSQILLSATQIPTDNSSFSQINFIKTEAAARLITLIRIAIASGDPEMVSIVINSSHLFRKEHADIWKNWLVQIIGLANTDWFCSMVSDLSKEMWYRSSLYSAKLGCKEISQSLQSRAEVGPRAMMTKLEESFDEIFSLNFKTLYKEIVAKDIEKAIQFRSSRRIPETHFEFAALQLNLDELNHIREYGLEETGELARSEEIVRKVNYSLPFIIPLRVDNIPQINIFRIYGNFRLLSPDLLIFYATTSTVSRQAFLIQRADDLENGFPTSIVSMANTTLLLKQLLMNCYQSRSRSLNLSAQPIFEVGPRYIMIPLPVDIECFSTAFSSQIGITHNQWLENYSSEQYSNNHYQDYTSFGSSFGSSFVSSYMSSYYDHADVNNGVPMLDENALTKYVIQKLTKCDYIRLRLFLLRSFAAQAAVRHIFNAPYQKIDRVLFSLENAATPLLHSDFNKKFTGTLNKSTFRLSPNMIHLFNGHCKGEFLIGMAASAKAFSSQIEIVRASLEILVGDPTTDIGETTPFNLLYFRNKIEERLLELSPPSSITASESDCIEWYSNIMQLIDQASNTKIQSPSAIPWF